MRVAVWFLSLALLGLLGCRQDESISPSAESDMMYWTLPDGTEFSAWSSSDNRGEEPVYLFVGLDSGTASYRIGESGAWQRMRLETEEDDEGVAETMFSATEDLPPGQHRVAFRITPPGGSASELCCVVATVQ